MLLRERIPNDLSEMVQYAEQFIGAHEGDKKIKRSYYNQQRPGAQGIKQVEGNQKAERQQGDDRQCFICHKVGHIAKECYYRNNRSGRDAQRDNKVVPRGDQDRNWRSKPQQNKTADKSETGAVSETIDEDHMPVCEGVVNGHTVKVLRDTGCSSAAVKMSLVSADQMTDKENICTLIDGTQRKFPIAKIDVDTPYFTGEVEAMCMDRPVYALILGNFQQIRTEPDVKWKKQANAVITRAQAKISETDNETCP